MVIITIYSRVTKLGKLSDDALFFFFSSFSFFYIISALLDVKVLRQWSIIIIIFIIFATMQVPIPGDDDTTYWCAALELPAEIQQQKQYIIRVWRHIA